MKIIYINGSRIPTERAHGLQIMKMCEALTQFRKNEIELWVPRRFNYVENEPFEYYGIERNFKIRRFFCIDLIPLGRFLGPLALWVTELSFLSAVVFYILRDKADIIYTRDKFAVFLLSFFKGNIFFETHDIPSRIFFSGFKRARGIIAITQGLKNEFIQRGVDAQKIIVAPDGVDLGEFNVSETQRECRKRLNLPLDKKIVLYTGHLYEWKGVGTLLNAAKFLIFNYQFLNTIFIFVGGTEKDTAEFRKKAEKLTNIVIVGHKPHSEIPYWLKAADIFALPNSAKYDISKYWTSPMKLFEYMASGRPIVASKLPSIREILNENNAVFFEPDNPMALARSIGYMLNDMLLAKRISVQAKLEVESYTWKKRAEKITNFLCLP